ncbi:MAG TPA: glycosyltransferase family 4 protein [Cellvibrio sp.]|nr:glycosyltransferase family 4 protein [Cellvibrio sp.]
MTAVKNTLLIANFDSGVGYAWSLIEDFWIAIDKENKKINRDSIICYPSISKIAPKIIEAKITTLIHDFNNKSIKQILKNVQFILKNNIDTLYITDQKKRSYKYAIYRLFGIKKIIVHDHSPGIRKNKNPIIATFKKAVANIIPGINCDAAFAVSPYITRRLQEIDALPNNIIYDITNGIKIRKASKRELNTSEVVKIVSVARLTPYKSIDFSLRALAEAIPNLQNKKVHYYIIGDGPELQSLIELTHTLTLTNNVTFMGKLDHTKVIDQLEQCDIAIHPSKGEAMSLAILEYMQSQLALLTSNNPSVCSAFVADIEGVTYEEGNISDAAEKLQLLIQNNQLRFCLGAAAREKVITHFSDTLMMDKFIAAYVTVISA